MWKVSIDRILAKGNNKYENLLIESIKFIIELIIIILFTLFWCSFYNVCPQRSWNYQWPKNSYWQTFHGYKRNHLCLNTCWQCSCSKWDNSYGHTAKRYLHHALHTKLYIHSQFPLQWRHNGRDGVPNHQPKDCLLNRLFWRRSKKIPKLRVTGLCAGNSPVTGEFPAQMASNAENVSIWWRHHVSSIPHGYITGTEATIRLSLSVSMKQP